MASSSSAAIFFTLSFFFLLVQSDDKLINTLCSKTPEPVICRECLNSDPTSKTADARALANIAVVCAGIDNNEVFERTLDLYHKTPPEYYAMKTLLDQCTNHFLTAFLLYPNVTNKVTAGDLGGAKGIVNKLILPDVHFCLDQFDRNFTRDPVPADILAGTNIVDQDYKIVLGLLNNI